MRAVTSKKQNNYLSLTTVHPLPNVDGRVLTGNRDNVPLETNVHGSGVAFIPGKEVELEHNAGPLKNYKKSNQQSVGTNTDETVAKKITVPVLLNKPSKLEIPPLSDKDINELNGEKWLLAELIDFLLKQGTPYWVPHDVVIPTPNVETLLDQFNTKAESTNPEDLQFVKSKRNEYNYFANIVIRILTFTLQKGHYCVLDMIVVCSDAEGDFFQSVTVYDSLLRSKRLSNKKN
jgi:hypothetical protein